MKQNINLYLNKSKSDFVGKNMEYILQIIEERNKKLKYKEEWELISKRFIWKSH